MDRKLRWYRFLGSADSVILNHVWDNYYIKVVESSWLYYLGLAKLSNAFGGNFLAITL